MSSYSQLRHQPRLPFLDRLKAGGKIHAIKIVVSLINQIRAWSRFISHWEYNPDVIKTYKSRPSLPVRIFHPDSQPSGSPLKFPTLFTIHGGGFTVGSPADDDEWNKNFAKLHHILVVALDYSKAPYSPFPDAINDLEALISETFADSQLSIDKQRCAIAGFSAGGNLALAVAQSKTLLATFARHDSPGFSAVIPLYPGVDRTVSREVKAHQRRYKLALSPYRNSTKDYLLGLGSLFEWSYLPVGQDLQDPLVSPIFAHREDLPPHIFMLACELDLTSHEAWRMACRLAGRPEPHIDDRVGQDECGDVGELELIDERFAWVDKEQGLRWLLIPDVVHAFDRLTPSMLGDETSVRDAQLKTTKVIQEIGDWLWNFVWTD